MDKILKNLIKKGVNIPYPNNVYIDADAVIEAGVTIEDNVHIVGKTCIETGAFIGSGSYITSSHIGKDTKVLNSRISDAYIGYSSNVGPYAHIHSESVLGDRMRVGNFVEVKNSHIGTGSKMAHLAYIGDADIGTSCNIGCGAIFVNYDGIKKQRSTIGNGVFIGSNVNVIAPVTIEDGAYVAAGSTLTIDLKARDMCIARARETVKAGRSKYEVK